MLKYANIGNIPFFEMSQIRELCQIRELLSNPGNCVKSGNYCQIPGIVSNPGIPGFGNTNLGNPGIVSNLMKHKSAKNPPPFL
jgi:hypothetical protein